MAIDDTISKAAERASKLRLSYAGAITPAEAHELWCKVPGATLVDVRTRAEWDYVGRIPGAVEIEFQTYPGNQLNPEFIAELERRVDKNVPVLFICRSGVRSHHAATLATQAGYHASYNVLEGFEGNRDLQGRRNSTGGWRVAGLPWTQS